jgi:hypothetical protein
MRHQTDRQHRFACQAIAWLPPRAATLMCILALIWAPAPAASKMADTFPEWAIHTNSVQGGTVLAYGAPRGSISLKQDPIGEIAVSLNLSTNQLELVDRRDSGPIRHQFYRQIHFGLPVYGSRIQISSRGDDPVFVSANPFILPGSFDPLPTFNLKQSQQLAIDLATANLAETNWFDHELVVLPRQISGLSEERLAWLLYCGAAGAEGSWRLMIDAHSGELIEQTSLTVNLVPSGISGEIAGQIAYPTPYGEVTRFPFPHAQCRIVPAGGGEPIFDYSDEAGLFSFPEVAEADSLITRLAGRYITIVETQLEGETPELGSSAPESPVLLNWSESDASGAAQGAYIFANRAHDRLKTMDPEFTWLDSPVPVVVNSTEGTCNAFAHLIPSAPFLQFQISNGLCENVAAIADVVYHEYTHLATMYAYLPEWAPEPFAEAFADYFAASLVNSSLIGQDLFGPGTMLRNLNNNKTWPVDPTCQQSPHCSGLVLSGALWDIRSALINECDNESVAVALADSLFHFMRSAKPLDFQSALIQMLLVDDDDGDLTNGTPHLELIVQGFANHNIYDSDFVVSHTPLADTETIGAERELTLSVQSILPPTDGGVRIFYRFNDNRYTEVPLTGTNGEYQFLMPGAPANTQVDYYFRLRDGQDQEVTVPASAPQELFSYFTGNDITAPQLFHQPPDYGATGSNDLWLEAFARDNSGQISSLLAMVSIVTADSTWSLQVPLSQKEIDPVDSNRLRFEALVPTGYLPAESHIDYHFIVTDGASEMNQVRLPDSGEFVVPVLRGRMWNFEDEPEDFQFSGDWEWGVPPASPVALSGAGLVGTGIDGPYGLGQISSLISSSVDLTGWDYCLIEFDCWYEMATDNDGVRVLVSSDDGASWVPLIPIGGYPDHISVDEDGDGTADFLAGAFSGTSNGWQRVRFMANNPGDQSLQIRWELISTESRNGQGWYIDNLRVVDRPALSAPVDLVASKGGDARVLLDWSAPPGVGPTTPGFQGYRIFRSQVPDQNPETALLDFPVFDTRWLDMNQLINGERYYYTIVAHYDNGYSTPSNVAEGYPYRASHQSAATHTVELDNQTALQTEISFINSGTGDLLLDFFLADRDAEWDEIIPQHSMSNPNESNFTLLLEDGIDATAPDIASLSCRVTNGYLILHIALHDTLPDPRHGFNLDVMIDTDLSHRTGIPSGYLGADYIARIGAIPYQATQELSYLINDRQEWITELYSTIIQEGSDFLEAAVPLRDLGNPANVGLALRTSYPVSAIGAPQDQSRLPDELPDPRTNSWIQLAETSGYATVHTGFDLGLDIDLMGMVDDDYEALLFTLSNDRDNPLTTTLITAQLRNVVPDGIADWSVRSESEGLHISWRSDLDHEAKGSISQPLAGFRIKRWSGELSAEPSEAYLMERLITADADSVFSFLDRGVESGERHFYRLVGVDSAGVHIAFAPPLHPLYAPPAANLLTLSAPYPNPFGEEITVRVQAPESVMWEAMVVDVSGRLVRWLAREGELDGGIYALKWDGTLENGIPATSGVYYAVVRSGSQRVSRSLVLIR